MAAPWPGGRPALRRRASSTTTSPCSSSSRSAPRRSRGASVCSRRRRLTAQTRREGVDELRRRAREFWRESAASARAPGRLGEPPRMRDSPRNPQKVVVTIGSRAASIPRSRAPRPPALRRSSARESMARYLAENLARSPDAPTGQRDAALIRHRTARQLRYLLRPRMSVGGSRRTTRTSARTLIERAHALLCFMTDTVDAELLDACPNLSLVACALKGFDNFDVAECARRGVAVTAVPDLLTAPTAELALARAGPRPAHARGATPTCVAVTFEGGGPPSTAAASPARRSASLARAPSARRSRRGSRALRRRTFSTTTSPRSRRRRSAPSGSPGATAASRACSRAPTFSSCARRSPRRRATRYAARRSKTPSRGSRLINVSRGSCVSEAAVADALEAGRLGGYAADVFEFEDWAWAGRPAEVEPRLRAHAATLFARTSARPSRRRGARSSSPPRRRWCGGSTARRWLIG